MCRFALHAAKAISFNPSFLPILLTMQSQLPGAVFAPAFLLGGST
jgi:hypothetical protein